MNPNDVLDALSEGLIDVPDLVFAFTPGGKYLFANTAAAKWLGFERDELIGYHWRELGFPERVMEPFMAKVAEVAQTDEPQWHQMVGSERVGNAVLDVSLTPLHTNDGGVMAVLVILRDVTEYVRGKG